MMQKNTKIDEAQGRESVTECQIKVSVIVPVFNQGKFLSEALDSVLRQTYPYWECVIVNDGSPDNTEEVARRYLDRDGRFKYLFQQNKGLSSARNAGITNSGGEYILPLDADDVIGSTYLEKAIRHFEEFPETKLVYCKAELFGEKEGCWDLDTYDYDRFIWRNCIFCTAMYRRNDYDKTKGYNVNMVHGYEDWDFWLTLINKEDVVHCIDEVLFYYRIKKVSMHTELTKRSKESLVQLYNNHPEIYDQYKGNILYYRSEGLEFEEEYREIKERYDGVLESNAYRVGKLLLRPLAWLRKHL